MISAKSEADEKGRVGLADKAQMRFSRPRGWFVKHKESLGRFYWAPPALLAFVFTSIGASRPSLWEDELATWSAARRSWSQLWILFGNVDVVMAPYYVFMHVWLGVFGESELSLRAPSILAATATAVLLAMLGRRLFSTRVGLLAGVLFAICPVVSRTGQEARVIAFTALFAVLATLALVAALDDPRWWRWLWYGASIVALGASSLIALLLIAAHSVFVVQRWWSRRDWKPMWWLISIAAGLLVLSPLVYLGHQQVAQIAWIPKPQWSSLPENFGIRTFGVFGSVALVCALLGLGLAGLKVAGRARGLLLAWCLVPPILLLIISIYGSQSYWLSRYQYFLIPAAILIAALLLSRFSLGHAAVLLVVIALLSLPFHKQIRAVDSHSSYDGRAVARYLSPRLQKGDVALFGDYASSGPRNLLRYYGPAELPDGLAVKSAEEVGLFDPTVCADTARCLSGVTRAWLFLRYFSTNDPFYQTPAERAEFLRRNFRLSQPHRIGAITLILLERNR